VDTKVIERLARLGASATPTMTIAVSWRYFSLETKKACCERWGAGGHPVCARTRAQPAQVARWRKFLAPSRPRAVRASGSISTLPRAIRLHPGVVGAPRRTARGADRSDLHGRLPGRSESAVEGHGSRGGRFDLPIDLPTGYHELEVKVAGGTATAAC